MYVNVCGAPLPVILESEQNSVPEEETWDTTLCLLTDDNLTGLCSGLFFFPPPLLCLIRLAAEHLHYVAYACVCVRDTSCPSGDLAVQTQI